MVTTTRAAAARQQQSSNAANVIPTGAVRKKSSKKKNELAVQRTTSSTHLSSPQSNTITSTTAVATLSPVKLFPAQNNNDHNGMNDGNERIDSQSMKLNQIENHEQDKSFDLDEKELDTITSWPITTGDIEWCKTNRGNDRICMCGYTYDFMSQSLKKNRRNFRCSKKDLGCRAVVYVYIDSHTYQDSNNLEHNHAPNHQDVKRLLVLKKIKERVMVEPTSITRIIEDEYVKNNLNDQDREQFLLPTAQASKFYKIRAKMVPPNPRLFDFEVPSLYTITHTGEEFLIYDSIHKKLGGRLMIFSTKVLIKMLCSCEVILIDGTFKTRPILFSQVYVIMGQHLDEAIPLVWCLTPKRTQDVYEKIFKVLKKKSIEYGVKFEPKCVYLDFEIATINALEKEFPDISIHGCWYHFTQSVFRNIQKIGLTRMYEKNEEVKTWLRSFMALPLIKKNSLDATIELLINDVPSSDDLLLEFINYFQKQWVTCVPPKYWNLGPIHLRCNNSVEGYNNRLQNRFGMHPQLWLFIHFLKSEESLVMMRTTQIRNGNYRDKAMPFSSGNERSRQKTKQMKNLARLFQIGSIDLKEYVTHLSRFVGESATKKKRKMTIIPIQQLLLTMMVSMITIFN